jgi:putative SOS response-associated peptidase YedK
MCGRYATTRGTEDLSALFEAVDESGGGLAPDYNVAPTDPVPIVAAVPAAPGRAVRLARWGLVPPWASDPRVGARMINARVETVATSRAYAAPFRERRCLVPADGWYEWRRRDDGRGKQAYFMTPVDGGVLAFAGLWTVSGEGLLSCSVLTTAAVGELAFVHDRMPLLLAPERWPGWLGRAAEPERLLGGPSAEFLATLEIRPVGPAVGDVRNDGPELTARIPVTPPASIDVEPTDLTLF